MKTRRYHIYTENEVQRNVNYYFSLGKENLQNLVKFNYLEMGIQIYKRRHVIFCELVRLKQKENSLYTNSETRWSEY